MSRWIQFLKEGAKSKKQRLEEANQMKDDESDVLHEFPDGYSIRRLTTNRDAYREGCLNGLCWAPGGAKPEGQENTHPKRELLPGLAQEDGKHYLSLRDENNLPVASFFGQKNQQGKYDVFEIEGNHNSPPKEEYVDRIAAWHFHASPHAKKNEEGEDQVGDMQFHTEQHDHPDVTGHGYPKKKYKKEKIGDIQDSNMHPWEVGDSVAISDKDGNVLDGFARVQEHAPKKGFYRIQSPLFGQMEATHDEIANKTDDAIQFHHSPYKPHGPAKSDVEVNVPHTFPDDWGGREAGLKRTWAFKYVGPAVPTPIHKTGG